MDRKLVSIIIPHYDNETAILERVIMGALNQKYKNKEIILVVDNPLKKIGILHKKFKSKIKIIKNSENIGLAGSLNEGIKKATGSIIVTLLEDCIPQNRNWLNSLVKSLNRSNVVAVASKVKNDPKLFRNFDPLVKDLMQDRKEIYSPQLDEKGCAYRKDALKKVGFFDSVHFKTAGEDFDIYYKLKKEGQIISGNEPPIIHIHPLNLKKIYVRSGTYARSAGVLSRIYGFKFIGKKGIFKLMFPFWGIAKGIKTPATYSKNKLNLIRIYIKLNWIHVSNFVESFMNKKQ